MVQILLANEDTNIRRGGEPMIGRKSSRLSRGISLGHVFRPENRERGVSLIEIATVLVILSIMVIFVAPELTGWSDKAQLKDTLDTFLIDMQKAKMHAIKGNVSVQFTITNSTGSYAANNCKNGSYIFTEVVSGDTVVGDKENDPTAGPITLADGFCITSTFAAGEGFDSRGLPISGGGGSVTIQKVGITSYTGKITQSVAGGIKLEVTH